MTNSVDPDQTAPIGAVCSGSTLFASILNSSVILGNYLQQTTSADDIFSCIFLDALMVNKDVSYHWVNPFMPKCILLSTSQNHGNIWIVSKYCFYCILAVKAKAFTSLCGCAFVIYMHGQNCSGR